MLFFVVVVVVFASISAAANCDINPLLIPLQLRNNTNGVLFRLKNQDFYLPLSVIQNVTVIDNTNNNTETGNVSLPDLNIELEKYEFSAWVGNHLPTNAIGIGLGLNSTFIQDLYQAKRIPTRSYGLSYNKTWGDSTSLLQVDSLVLGGYDKSRIDGDSYELEITSDGLLDVEVDSIVINLQDGTKEPLFNGSTFNATLDNNIDQIILPFPILNAYGSAVGANIISAYGVLDSKQYDTLLIHNKLFTGNMTIKLSNGFEATIPPELLSRAVNDRTISSIVGSRIDPAKGVLGSVFLSQLYLSVDYESMKFSTSKRATGDEKTSELEKISCSSSSSTSGSDDGKGNSATTSTTTTTSSKGTSMNKILGSVLGSLLSVIVVLTLVLFLLKRYKQKKKIGYTPHGNTNVTGYERYSEAASTSRPSWLDAESVRVKEMNEKAVAAGIQLPLTPSRVSVVPSRGDTPARNSYFTEELDISRERDSG
ncbi:hypothetical protein BDD12DRAFT_881264 [Trichophaea hybrida]|nr:hypothetical protein BDD12DRAFT_881264 [Trichophaea hybrida]